MLLARYIFKDGLGPGGVLLGGCRAVWITGLARSDAQLEVDINPDTRYTP